MKSVRVQPISYKVVQPTAAEEARAASLNTPEFYQNHGHVDEVTITSIAPSPLSRRHELAALRITTYSPEGHAAAHRVVIKPMVKHVRVRRGRLTHGPAQFDHRGRLTQS